MHWECSLPFWGYDAPPKHTASPSWQGSVCPCTSRSRLHSPVVGTQRDVGSQFADALRGT